MQHRQRRFVLLTCLILASGSVTAQWSTDTFTGSRAFPSAATVGDRAFFAGGTDNVSSVTDVVDIYDANTDTWSTETLPSPRAVMGVAVLGDLVFFAGGGPSSSSPSAVVDVFDSSSDTWSTATLSQARFFPAGASVGTKVFFAGGDTYALATGPVASAVVDIYDSVLGPPDDPAAWSVGPPLCQARTQLSAVTVGTQVLFAGGHDFTTSYDNVDIYDEAGGSWSMARLSEPNAKPFGSSTSVGSLAFFGGGQATGFPPFGWSAVVDIYNAQTGEWSTESMSVPRGELCATAVGDTVLFAGGATGAQYSPTDVVETYDVTTGQWGPVAHLSQARFYMAATTVAGKALFAGGADAPFSSFDVVDVYEPGAWTDLGGGSPGVAGTPWLYGTGSLVGGTSASVALRFAPPGALSLAWIALAPTPFAVLEGTVHAYPYTTQLTVVMDPAGSFSGAATWPPGLPMGTEAWFQFVVQDATSVHGITLSNGVLATTP